MFGDGRPDVRMPGLFQATLKVPDLVTPVLHWLDDEEADLNDYLADPTEPVLCVSSQYSDQFWRMKSQYHESMYGEPGSTMNYWQLSVHSERLTLGMKMHSTAAFLSMSNEDGVVLGGNTDRGFNDNSARGYPTWLSLTTRQVTDVVMYDEEILSVKGGRQVPEPEPHLDDETRSERTRQLCALKYLHGYPDYRVVDPIKENYPACTMPLAATSPAVVTPEILCNIQYAQESVAHVALIREMLGQASLPTNTAVLERCKNKLFQGLCGLLKGASNCQLTREPIPSWNIVKVVRTKPTAELVKKTTSLMSHEEGAHINMPCAPMPIPDMDDTSLMHPALVTELTGSKPHYRQGGLIPHLSRRGLFWKSTRPAIHETVYIYQYHLDSTVSTRMEQVERIACGWTPPLPRLSDYNPSTGLHKSLGIDSVQGASQHWIAKDGPTSKAASPAGPPSWSASVQGLTQHFEQLSMKGGTHASEVWSFLDDPSDPPEKVQLNHEEVSWEYYTGHCFAVPELVPGIDRHHGTRLKMNALGGELAWTLNQEIMFSTALTGRPKKKLFFSQYCWKRCVIGTTEDYADATSKQEWEFALMKGDLHGLQSFDTKETTVLCPYNNTEYTWMLLLTWKPSGVTSGQLCATTTCRHTKSGQPTCMGD